MFLGIRAPKLARNANDKSEPFGAESHDFSCNVALQRDVSL
jgi:staphylococcal nuclease domain-containing protein 1